MATSVREAVKNAILFYEPRIDIVRISLETDGLTEGRIDLRVDYIIRATNTRTNLVFPFYLDEATDTDV
jgi:phage baseplate assembly protein W